MKKGVKRHIWQCDECKDVIVSYSHLRHDMNTCDNGCSSLDVEEDYVRGIGKPITLSIKEWDGEKWVRDEK